MRLLPCISFCNHRHLNHPVAVRQIESCSRDLIYSGQEDCDKFQMSDILLLGKADTIYGLLSNKKKNHSECYIVPMSDIIHN